MSETPEQPRDVFDEAADWWQRSRAGTEDDLVALAAWLDADPRHREAFEQVRASWETIGEFHVAPEILKMRTHYLGRAEKRWRQRLNPVSPTRRAVLAAGVAVAAAVIATPLVILFAHREFRSITTGIGEQRVVALSDGSRVTLDANSQLDINFDRELRLINLVRGRVHFDVAKDVARPFRVRALENTVTAIGTAFTVELRRKTVSVTLFEGRITVANLKSGKRQEAEMLPEVAPGQEVVIREGRPTPPQYLQVDAKRALAWRDSQLFFDEEPLSSVADRMNDYSKTRISVVGAANNIPVSGMFIAGQTDSFLRAIEKFYPVEVVSTSDGIRIQPRG